MTATDITNQAEMPSAFGGATLKFQLSGSILVDAVINSEGKLETVRIVHGLPDGLNDRTIATLKTWRCNPALKDGKAVPTRVQMEVHFKFRPNSSGYEVFDSRKELEAKGEHGNSMAEMSLPQDAGQDVQPATLVHRVSPDYPGSWKKEGLQGTVHLHMTIAKDGSVRDIQIVNGDSRLAKSAEKAVKQWRYKAALRNGVPVETQATVAVTFSLKNPQ